MSTWPQDVNVTGLMSAGQQLVVGPSAGTQYPGTDRVSSRILDAGELAGAAGIGPEFGHRRGYPCRLRFLARADQAEDLARGLLPQPSAQGWREANPASVRTGASTLLRPRSAASTAALHGSTCSCPGPPRS